MLRTFTTNILYLLIFLVLAFASVSAQSNVSENIADNTKEVVGEYVYSSGFVGAIYKITADGKFEYSTFSDCCDPVLKEFGTYILKDNQLHFKISQKTLNDYNLLDSKQATEAFRKLYHYKGEEIKTEAIEKEYVMQVVKWGERYYLIKPEKLHLFTAAVNLGIEPRWNVINRNYLTTEFFLRADGEKKITSGKPLLPEPFASSLLNISIKAKIIKIDSTDKEKIYTVNKGSKSGIKIGMALIEVNAEPDDYDFLWVISVDENSAKIQSNNSISRVRDYQIDQVVTTKIVK